MWEVLTLRKPWAGVDVKTVWRRVQRGMRPTVLDADEAAAPEGFIDLMFVMWSQSPSDRCTFAIALARLRAMAPRRLSQETWWEGHAAAEAADPDTVQPSCMFWKKGPCSMRRDPSIKEVN